MNRNRISISCATIATAAHTATIYGAPILGLKRVDIGKLISKKIMKSDKRFAGLVVHALLGIVIFPTSYNLVAHQFLPKNKTASGLAWGISLWSVGHSLIVPFLGGSDYFKKRPSARATYFLAHVAYGLLCTLDRKHRQ